MFGYLIKNKEKFFFGIVWICFFASLNLSPDNFFSFNLISQLRFLAPLLVTAVVILIFFKHKYFNNLSFFLFVPILYVALGFYFTLTNKYNFSYNIFWPIVMIGSYLYLCLFSEKKKMLILFLKLNLIIILCIFTFYVSYALMDDARIYNFYTIYVDNNKFLGFENPPRSSGLARMALILYATTITLFLGCRRILKKPIYFFVVILGAFTLVFQSRTISFIFFFITFYVVLINFNKLSKREITATVGMFILCLLINFTTQSYFKYAQKKLDYNTFVKRYGENSPGFKFIKRPQFGNLLDANDLSTSLIREADPKTYSSGRATIWKKIIVAVKKNNYMGYGFQGDRIVAKDSAHSVYLYALTTGGGLGFILILIILFRSIFVNLRISWNIFSNNGNIDYKTQIPLILSIIFLLRGILDTSYGVYSIDFLIFFTCYLYNEITFSKIYNG